MTNDRPKINVTGNPVKDALLPAIRRHSAVSDGFYYNRETTEAIVKSYQNEIAELKSMIDEGLHWDDLTEPPEQS